eukprot:16444260-Heterocapsa_arctica.AAC.1
MSAYAGPASRWAQRLMVFEADFQGWPLAIELPLTPGEQTAYRSAPGCSASNFLKGIAELTFQSRVCNEGYVNDSDDELNDPDYFLHNMIQCPTLWNIRGSEAEHEAPPMPPLCFIAVDMDETKAMLYSTPQHWGVDV